MNRTVGVTLSALVALTAMGILWHGFHAPSPPRAARPAAADAHDARRPLELASARAVAESALDRRSSESDPSTPAPALTDPVRVHGCVLRAGVPVEGVVLSFHHMEGGRARPDVDWDFTDDEGRFEVRLPAARYEAWNEDDEVKIAQLSVSPDAREVVLDIDLEFGVLHERTVSR
jgi:hypothetical protein